MPGLRSTDLGGWVSADPAPSEARHNNQIREFIEDHLRNQSAMTLSNSLSGSDRSLPKERKIVNR